MADAAELDSLNLVKYLYLRELTEPRDNSLRIVVQEAISNPPLPKLSEPAGKVVHISRIESTDTCRTFELTWKRYVAYLVTEEVVGSRHHEDEIYTGKLFRTYTKSRFLDYMAQNTGGHMNPVLHFQLLCLNHLIDVAAYDEPEFEQIDSGPCIRSIVH